MSTPVRVRQARVEDAAEMARVNVRSWRETYRGNRVALAERDGDVIGIAMAGPAQNSKSQWGTQLYVLYVVAAEHGTGAGAALLDAVIGPDDAAALWVADPNPRAQAFYRKHGFVADGTVMVDDGVREIRMVRLM